MQSVTLYNYGELYQILWNGVYMNYYLHNQQNQLNFGNIRLLLSEMVQKLQI